MPDQIDASVVAAAKQASNGNGRIVWPDGPAKKQYFSLSDNIIYYMIQTLSSPEVYLKLAMSCKYFFGKKPLLIVARISGNTFCSNKDYEECNEKNNKCCVKIDLAKLTSKIWLTHQYKFYDIPSFDALVLQKLYKCRDAIFSSVMEEFALDNFNYVASSFEKYNLAYVEMTDEDGNDVMLEEILGSLPMVKEFDYTFAFYATSATTLTMKNVLKLDNLDDLRLFHLFDIPEICDVKDFEDFIMKYRDIKIGLHFRFDISEEYKTQLAALCDTLIAAKVCKCVIEYYGQDKLAIMRERYAE